MSASFCAALSPSPFAKFDFPEYNIVKRPQQSCDLKTCRWIEQETTGPYMQINTLKSKSLRHPITVKVEKDGEEYLIKFDDLGLYGYGETVDKALDFLKEEIESLYDDLMEDDNFSEEWLSRKKYLKDLIS